MFKTVVLKKIVVIFLIFMMSSFMDMLIAGQNKRSDDRQCFRAFVRGHFNREKMKEHLDLIAGSGYPKQLSEALFHEFNHSQDPAFRGMLARMLGQKSSNQVSSTTGGQIYDENST